jgi:hypothetical protein
MGQFFTGQNSRVLWEAVAGDSEAGKLRSNRIDHAASGSSRSDDAEPVPSLKDTKLPRWQPDGLTIVGARVTQLPEQ